MFIFYFVGIIVIIFLITFANQMYIILKDNIEYIDSIMGNNNRRDTPNDRRDIQVNRIEHDIEQGIEQNNQPEDNLDYIIIVNPDDKYTIGSNRNKTN